MPSRAPRLWATPRGRGAEGGVHWVPAAGRRLIASYAAVRETELDEGVFPANEEGSLMLRAPT